jgi:hypothetical protein
MNRRALEGREKALGKEHPGTLTSVYTLAFLFVNSNSTKAASELYQWTSSGYKHLLGPKYPTALACFQEYSPLMQVLQVS